MLNNKLNINEVTHFFVKTFIDILHFPAPAPNHHI